MRVELRSVYSCVRITEISKERSAGNNKESELTCVCVCVRICCGGHAKPKNVL